MPPDGPTIYIDNRPFTPSERIARFKPQAGTAGARRQKRRGRIVDRVTISNAARKMYRLTYGKKNTRLETFPMTYDRFVAAGSLKAICHGGIVKLPWRPVS